MCLHAEDLINYDKIFNKVNSTEELNEEEIRFLEKHRIKHKFEIYRNAYLMNMQLYLRGNVSS